MMNPNFENLHLQLERDYWWFKARRNLISILLKRYSFKPPILDIGTGSGENLEILSRFGYSIGVDISISMIEYGRRQGRNVTYGNAENLPFEDETFRSVTALDVLEHVNDKKALSEIYRVLKPGGKLLVTVPAFNWLWSVHDEINNHKRRYTKNELINLLSTCGFRTLFLSYWNFTLFIPSAILKKIDNSHNLKSLPKWLNQALYYFVQIDNMFVLKEVSLPIGTSIVIVGEKI